MLGLVAALEFAGSAAQILPIGPKGGGACSTAHDCQLAGVCTDSKCVCDPGWTGPLCHQLDLVALPAGFTGGAWNSELSSRSSWGAAPHKAEDGKYHGWFNQLPDKCGLSSWLPGSYIEHGVADSPLGPFVLVNNTPSADGKPDPLNGKDRFATNPHVAYVKSEKRYLLFFNGREWPANDLTNCWPSDNKTDTDGSHFHGGGACTSDNDCAGAFAGTDAHQGGAANICGKDGKCSCEHHSMGPHCNIITETVNVASALSPNGPWTQLNPDGAAFWSDSEIPGGDAATRANLSNPDGGKYLSNPSAFVLDNGTVVLAYSRAPGGPGGTGISVAPHWKGPYTRLTLPYPGPVSKSPFKGGKNYSIVGCGEDPFIYKDFRDTWRVLCHGGEEKTEGTETIGMAFSTDLLHWTAGPGPAATSMMHYADGSTRKFGKRERPALLLDHQGFPLVLYSGAQAPNASYHCGGPWNVTAGEYHNGGDNDPKCHCWSFAQATTHGNATL